MPKRTIHDVKDLKGKRALIRVDFNVPLDATGQITNDRRIRAALPTIRRVLDAGGSAVLMSHLGRPKRDPKKDANLRMDAVARRLGELLGKPVAKAPGVVGPEVAAVVRGLKPGEATVLDNLRFDPREQAGDEAFGREIASLGDFYVNDAFGTCHRKDASMVAVPHAMKGKPRVVGSLVAKELDILGQLLSAPKHPFLAILGGAKVSDKIGFIKSLLGRADGVLVGGAMTYTFMKAQGRGVGSSRFEADKLDVARELLALAGAKLELPSDHLVVSKIDDFSSARVVEGDIPDGWIGVDIGPKTIERYAGRIEAGGMVLWNGPMGKFEAVAESMAKSKGVTVVGGGETAEAVEEFGLADRMSHVSTGGGAFLEYVEGTPFPALAEIDDR